MSENKDSVQASIKDTMPSGRRIFGFALISVLIALMLTLLLEALDQTIVGTALPTIVGQFQGFDRYSWVVTAYLLASTTMIPLVSKLSDQFGRKWFLVTGVVIFLTGSALSGMAQDMNQLIAFRAVQGTGAGIGIALVFTVVGDIFPPAERARWQGVFAAVYGLSSVVGPTLGGWLTDHGPLLGTLVTNATRWRWIFYINLPIGIIALAALVFYLPSTLSTRSTTYRGWAAFRRVDFAGALLMSSATICLLLGLTWGSDQTYAWNSQQVIGILVAAGVLYTIFFVAERFAREPLLPLDLFRNQIFASASGVTFLVGMILLPLVIYLPLYLQGVLGESATNSGAVITPLTISVVIGASISGQLVARFKRYQAIAIAGMVILSTGLYLMSRMSALTNPWEASIYMIITGVGMGSFFPLGTLAVQNAIQRSRMGVGTGAITYMRALGQTLGAAIVGTVINNTIASDLLNRVPANAQQQLTAQGWKYATNTQVLVDSTYRAKIVQTAQQAATAKATANIPAGPQHDAIAQQVAQQVQTLLNQVFAGLKESLVLAVQNGFLVLAVIAAIAVIVALFLKDVPLATSFKPEDADKTEDAVAPIH